jgi:hypothetical protein
MNRWATSPGTYITAQSYIDGADQVAVEAERKWGAGRLRLLVSAELREKFDRQRYLYNQAIWHGDLEAVRREAQRMATAWRWIKPRWRKAKIRWRARSGKFRSRTGRSL